MTFKKIQLVLNKISKHKGYTGIDGLISLYSLSNSIIYTILGFFDLSYLVIAILCWASIGCGAILTMIFTKTTIEDIKKGLVEDILLEAKKSRNVQ